MDENKVNDVSADGQEQVEAEAVEETAAEAETESTVTQEQVGSEPSKSGSVLSSIKGKLSGKAGKRVIGLLVVIIVLVCAASVTGIFSTAESVALKFVKATADFDAKTASRYLAYDIKAINLYNNDCEGDEDAFFDKMSDDYDEDIRSWNDYFKAMHDSNVEDFIDLCGDYTISCEVSRTKDISEKKVKDYYSYELSKYEKRAGLDIDDIGAGKIITVKGKYETEDEGIVRFTCEVVVVKCSSAWKVLDYNMDFKD